MTHRFDIFSHEKFGRIVPGIKPVGDAYPLDRVKKYLRITGTDQDEVTKRLISAAAGIIEHHTTIVMASRTYTMFFDDWAGFFTINKFPVTALSSIKYFDVDNNQQTLVVDTDYWFSLNGDFARVTVDNMPVIFDDRYDAIEVAFVAGYADRFKIPDEHVELLEAVTKDLYDQRGLSETGVVNTEIQSPAIKSMLSNYSKRVFR